jgi:hypothetical protein
MFQKLNSKPVYCSQLYEIPLKNETEATKHFGSQRYACPNKRSCELEIGSSLLHITTQKVDAATTESSERFGNQLFR